MVMKYQCSSFHAVESSIFTASVRLLRNVLLDTLTCFGNNEAPSDFIKNESTYILIMSQMACGT